jgi:hypothetical protein
MSVNQIILPEIKFKNNLSKHNIVFSLIEKIAEKIKLIPQYEKIRVEIELVKTVCNIVENYVQKNNSKDKNKVDKKQLVIDALTLVFIYSEPEKVLIASLIDFLFNNSQIKKSSFYKLSKNFILSYIKTK